MFTELHLIPGMYSLRIRTMNTCCVRFNHTPFGSAWMTDINMSIDTPSDEKDMKTLRTMLDSLEAVPYRNRGDMEQHAAEANRLLTKARKLLKEQAPNFYKQEPDTLCVIGAAHAPELSLVADMVIVVTPMYV